MNINEEYNRRASLLLSRVRAELAERPGNDLPSVRHMIALEAERTRVPVLVEMRARDAWFAQERLALPRRAENPRRLAMLALAQAAVLLRWEGRVAA